MIQNNIIYPNTRRKGSKKKVEIEKVDNKKSKVWIAHTPLI